GSGGLIDPSVTRLCGTCSGAQVLVGSGTGSGSFGGVYINSKWNYSLTGAYQIPVVEASLGFNLNGRQGYALPYVTRVNAGAEGFKFLLASNSVDTFRNPNVTDLDLRLAKDLRFNRIGLTLSVDAFNVMNSNTILQRD